MESVKVCQAGFHDESLSRDFLTTLTRKYTSNTVTRLQVIQNTIFILRVPQTPPGYSYMTDYCSLQPGWDRCLDFSMGIYIKSLYSNTESNEEHHEDAVM